MGRTVKKKEVFFMMHFHGGPQDGLVMGPAPFAGTSMNFPFRDKNGRWGHHVYTFVEFDIKSRTAKAVYGRPK